MNVKLRWNNVIKHFNNEIEIKFLWGVFVLIFIGCLLNIKIKFDQYQILSTKEMSLRTILESKHNYLNDLDRYRKQTAILTHQLKKRGKSLATRDQIPRLLDDISKSSIKNGLILESFTPLQECENDTSHELPIAAVISGRYENIMQFLCDLAQMTQLISWHDFNLSKVESDASGEQLRMQITIKIYISRNE